MTTTKTSGSLLGRRGGMQPVKFRITEHDYAFRAEEPEGSKTRKYGKKRVAYGTCMHELMHAIGNERVYL